MAETAAETESFTDRLKKAAEERMQKNRDLNSDVRDFLSDIMNLCAAADTGPQGNTFKAILAKAKRAQITLSDQNFY